MQGLHVAFGYCKSRRTCTVKEKVSIIVAYLDMEDNTLSEGLAHHTD